MKIIQASYPRSGSTVLTNILYGLFEPGKPVICGAISTKSMLVKTHELNIKRWVNFPEVFIICSERDKKYPEYYYSTKNVLIIKYEELLETENQTIEIIVNNLYDKLRSFLPDKLFTDKLAMVNNAVIRIKEMNALYEKIKHLKFSYHDSFFHIHGSHRGRGQK